MNEGIGQRLRECREALGMSQAGLATATGAAKTTIQQYERDDNVPGGKFLRAVMELGVNVNWLLSGSGPMFLSQLSEAGAAGGVDQSALADVIALIEDWLAANDRVLTPLKKAEVIALAYEIATENPEADSTMFRNNVVRLLRVAS